MELILGQQQRIAVLKVGLDIKLCSTENSLAVFENMEDNLKQKTKNAT